MFVKKFRFNFFFLNISGLVSVVRRPQTTFSAKRKVRCEFSSYYLIPTSDCGHFLSLDRLLSIYLGTHWTILRGGRRRSRSFLPFAPHLNIRQIKKFPFYFRPPPPKAWPFDRTQRGPLCRPRKVTIFNTRELILISHRTLYLREKIGTAVAICMRWYGETKRGWKKKNESEKAFFAKNGL